MKKIITAKQHTIDASGKRLGRVATEAAAVLIGKNDVDFAPNVINDITVTIVNASKLDVPERKGANETYQSYSGYPGGLRSETLSHLATRRGYAEVVKRTVSGMLPKNKHRKRLMTQLVVTE
ncbi:50S ribosomal protein L13 [Patescibacteria group bacterium]|nr:50S ribosomal protein L13 [Patescibacteria group bacterium]